jgi:uncharacterized protein
MGRVAMMRIDVSQLLKEPVGSEREYQISGKVNIMGDDTTSKVQGKIKLIRTNRSILVKGEFSTEVEVACARCLSMFGCPLKLTFEEEYLPLDESPLPADEAGIFTIDENQTIDLTEAVRQYALLAMPMKPLCRPDCSGL